MTHDLSRRGFVAAAAAGVELVRRGLARGAMPDDDAAFAASDAAFAEGLASVGLQPARPNAAGWIVLDARFKETTLAGTRARVRAYCGTLPGPVITVRQGELLRIRLQNSLPHYDSSAWDGNMNVPHHLDQTNLHVHGMDVIPHLFQPLGTPNPLAPMIAVKPGGHQDYPFQVPNDHPPGLYWYHPHHHGSTVVQAVTGMAGAIIVRGPIDDVPEIKAARDLPLVIQDIGLFPSETDATLWTYEPKQNAIWQTFGGYVTIYDPTTKQPVKTTLKGGFTTGDYALRYFLINGQPFFKETHNPDPNKAQQPVGTQLAPLQIHMQPGEVVRFRMLNGNSDNLMPIVVEGHEMYLLALDGNNFGAPRVIPSMPVDGTGNGQVLLAPSNRAEFLIKANATPGKTYRIMQLAQSQQFLQSEAKVIAEIVVAGASKDMALPKALPLPKRNYPLIQPGEIKRRRRFQFSGIFPGVVNPVVGIDFLVNNMQYDEFAAPNVTRVGDAEEWHIVVGDMNHGGTEGHPFHIHVNNFEVISIGGVAQPPGTLQDAVWVPENTEVVIRMRFLQWTGKSVFHCHILPHEDTGMMQNFVILPRLTAADPHAASRHT